MWIEERKKVVVVHQFWLLTNVPFSHSPLSRRYIPASWMNVLQSQNARWGGPLDAPQGALTLEGPITVAISTRSVGRREGGCATSSLEAAAQGRFSCFSRGSFTGVGRYGGLAGPEGRNGRADGVVLFVLWS